MLRHLAAKHLAVAFLLVAGSAKAQAQDLKVVASSKTVHGLVAAVMEGVGNPQLIAGGNASPHTFTLKPSDAKSIGEADIFFRVSEAIEPFTGKLAKTLPKLVKVVTLADVPGLTQYKRRIGGSFETHSHDHHKGHNHDHSDDESDPAMDGHVWLDPENARKMVAAIALELSAKAPANKERFEANARAFDAKIVALSADIAARMKPLAGRPFVVFHDATQYFERRFGLAASGSITVSPDVQPSAKRLNAVRKKIRSQSATCVFREPGYQEKLLNAVVEGTDAKGGLLDPEALGIEPGPRLYLDLMSRLAAGFTECLSPKS